MKEGGDSRWEEKRLDSVEEFHVRLASKPLPIFCFLVSIVNFLLPRAELPLGVSSLLYT